MWAWQVPAPCPTPSPHLSGPALACVPAPPPRCPAQGEDIVQRLLPLLPRLGAAPSDLLAVNFGERGGAASAHWGVLSVPARPPPRAVCGRVGPASVGVAPHPQPACLTGAQSTGALAAVGHMPQPRLATRRRARAARPSHPGPGLHHGTADDYGAALASFTAHVQQRRDQLPRVLWQQTSQQHFNAPPGSGEYPGGRPPFECGPIANLSVVVGAAGGQGGPKGVAPCRTLLGSAGNGRRRCWDLP